jgi:radical SAM protein with 4Fe4S-binding SPASM domain
VERIPYFNDPFFLQWHITDKCPLHCKHCYRDDKRKDLSYDVLLSILDKFTDFLSKIGKKGRIQFAGGEPLVSPYLPQLAKEATKRGLPTRVLSSGVGLTEELARKLKDCGVSIIQISLEGGCDKNDEIRGTGNFKKAVQAMEIAKKAGLEVTVSMTVSKVNFKEIPTVYAIAKEKADRFIAARFIPTGYGDKQIGKNVLSPKEVKKMFSLMQKYKKEGVIDIPYRDPLWAAYNLSKLFPPKENFVTGCSAGYNGITIEANGDIMPCRRLPIVIGNILQDDLEEVWNNSEVLNNIRDRDKLKGNCGQCKIKWFCGGCRGFAWAMTGDYLNFDCQCFR